MSDLLFILGAILLVLAAGLFSLVLGVGVAGLMLVLVAVALSDGKGVSWRS